MVKVSAPGKLMLFGEHAVVYDRPCIVTAISRRIYTEIKKSNKTILNSPDIGIKNLIISSDESKKCFNSVKIIKKSLENFCKEHDIKANVKINIDSSELSNFGLGSSSAVIVSLIKGLDYLFKTDLNDKELFNLCYKTVLDVYRIGSGFDIAAAIYGGTLYFITSGKKIEKLKVKKIPLVVGYTGAKANTRYLVRRVRKKFEKNIDILDNIFDSISIIVKNAKNEIENNNWREVGKLMNSNQILLEKLGVNTPKLSELINAARNSGAYGAKLSGAGGGDCMIALASTEKCDTVKDAISDAGGKIISVSTNSNGVIVEKN